MAVPRRTAHGLRNIRTHCGRGDRADTAYKMYMRLSALEREKVRLVSERESVVMRLKGIEGRLLEIDREEMRLLRAMEMEPPGEETGGGHREGGQDVPESIPEPQTELKPERRTDAFRFRY